MNIMGYKIFFLYIYYKGRFRLLEQNYLIFYLKLVGKTIIKK